jgi:uncharacterized membrane protein
MEIAQRKPSPTAGDEPRRVEERGAATPEKPPRLNSVDLLRGLVMIVMALDHARWPYFTNVPFGPENMQRTYLALFLTRWITHYCAPLFFLLAGVGGYLSLAQGRSVKEVSGFFWKRGLWLVFLELTVIAFAWSFWPSWRFGGVIWALGWSMVAMALIVRLPLSVVAIFGVGMMVFHQFLAGLEPASFGRLSWLWRILYAGGEVKIEALNISFPILYVLIPWVGVMAAGYALGRVLTFEPARRRRWLSLLGGAMTLAFVILRSTNLYGNPGAFHPQPALEKSVILFLNVAKYPASLQFLLMTIGPALLLLAWIDRIDWRVESALAIPSTWMTALARKVLVFGRVPMFYYLLHIYTLHLLTILVGLLWRQPVRWLWGTPLPLGRPAPPGYGHGLPFVYAMTLLVVILLYFPCRWFADLKRRRKDWFLRYI